MVDGEREAAADLLEGAIDLHVHAAPDVRERKLTMLEAAREAARHRMRGIVLKSHHEPTAGHAAAVSLLVPGVGVYGGVALNRYVGGLNPDAVEAAASLGGRIVWLPTFTARYHLHEHGEDDARGVTVLGGDGRLSAAALEVLEVVVARGMALATGHLSPVESVAIVAEAHRRRVRAILVNHPEMPFIEFPLPLQRELARLDGVFFERCYNAALGTWAGEPARVAAGVDRIARDVRTIGVEGTVLASDLGQTYNPAPAEGLAAYLRALRERGFTDAELERMARTNPARVLGL